MSILSSVKSGYKYAKWNEDLRNIAKIILIAEQHNIKPNFVRSFKVINDVMKAICYKVPTYNEDYAESDVFNITYEEYFFYYRRDWTVEEFVQSFKKEAENVIDKTRFELEDIILPPIIL